LNSAHLYWTITP